jgi:hypothetical protein
MNKKGSMELSVNSIVILVIAIVMLGLILGFVRTKFSDVGKGINSKEPDAPSASASEPITLSRNEILASPGDSIALKVNIFNPDTGNYSTVQPILVCSGTDPTTNKQTNNKSITAAKQGTYILNFNIPASTVKSNYLCTVKASNDGGTTSIINISQADVVIKIE